MNWRDFHCERQPQAGWFMDVHTCRHLAIYSHMYRTGGFGHTIELNVGKIVRRSSCPSGWSFIRISCYAWVLTMSAWYCSTQMEPHLHLWSWQVTVFKLSSSWLRVWVLCKRTWRGITGYIRGKADWMNDSLYCLHSLTQLTSTVVAASALKHAHDNYGRHLKSGQYNRAHGIVLQV